MKPLFHQPISLDAIARFHREVVLPDLARIVDRVTTPRFDVVRTEHEFIKLGLARIEIRLDQMDRRLERREARDRELLAAILRLEERLARLESGVGTFASPPEGARPRGEQPRSRVDAIRARMQSAAKHLAQ